MPPSSTAAPLRVEIVLNDAAWEQFRRALDPARFRAAIRVGIKRGLKRAARYLAVQMRSAINRRIYTSNKALTIALKFHAKPLVGSQFFDMDRTERFVEEIGWVLKSETEVHIGAVRGSVWKGKRYNIAQVIHDGIKIKITPKMAQWLARAEELTTAMHGVGAGFAAASIVRAERKRYHRDIRVAPYKAGTKGYIVIPPRPWLVRIFSSGRHQAKVGSIISDAVIERMNYWMRRSP